MFAMPRFNGICIVVYFLKRSLETSLLEDSLFNNGLGRIHQKRYDTRLPDNVRELTPVTAIARMIGQMKTFCSFF